MEPAARLLHSKVTPARTITGTRPQIPRRSASLMPVDLSFRPRHFSRRVRKRMSRFSISIAGRYHARVFYHQNDAFARSPRAVHDTLGYNKALSRFEGDRTIL
jgi:hypothetical protein